MDNGLDFTRTDYKSGFCIFGFDISLSLSVSFSLCHGKTEEHKRNGTLRANTEFRTPLPNSKNVITYMEFIIFYNIIFVDKTR